MRTLAALLLCLLSGSSDAGTVTSVASTLGVAANTTDSFFVFADNQNMVYRATQAPNTPGSEDQEVIADWICANKGAQNIKAAVTVGDLVRTAATTAQWTEYAKLRDILVACDMPLLPTYGNHDGVSTVSDISIPQDATNFHTYVGQSWLDLQPWFIGDRPDWTEIAGPGGFLGQSLYDENTNTFASRSYWVQIPPFVFIDAEWEQGIRWGARDGRIAGYPAAFAEDWALDLAAEKSNRYMIFVTHAGPCHPPVNCDLTPEDIPGVSADPTGSGGNYTDWLEMGHENMIAYLNGHWGRQSCLGGGGTYAQAVRDNGSAWIAGGWDVNCEDRRDPGVALNTCPSESGAACVSNPYTWNGWMQLKRLNRQLCFNTIRVIDVDDNNDGEPNIEEAVGATDSCYAGDAGCALGAAVLDQGSIGYPAATDNDCDDTSRTFDAGTVTGCPNMPETCLTIRDL